MKSNLAFAGMDPDVLWPTFWATLVATIAGVFFGILAEKAFQRRQERNQQRLLAAERDERNKTLANYNTTITVLYDIRDFGGEVRSFLADHSGDLRLPGMGQKYAARALAPLIDAKLVREDLITSYAFLYAWSMKLEERVERMLFEGVPEHLRDETEWLARLVSDTAMKLIEIVKREPDLATQAK